jgi:type IV secretory pathway VirB2 component (pilin)
MAPTRSNPPWLVILATALAFVLLDQLGSAALAQTLDEAADNVITGICTVINVARGPLTWVLLVAAVVVGGIMRLVGNPRGLGVIAGGIIGVAIVLLAPAIATTFFAEAAASCIQ